LETKYVKAYSSVSEVLSQDDEAWPKLLALGQQLESEKTHAFCQSRTHLIPMYRDAVAVQPTFDSTFQQIATDSNAKFTAAPMKHLCRALEKTSMKPADDANLDRAVNVCDVRRGMLVYANFGDMVRGIEATVAHLDIVVMRTKDRYSSPTSGGWMDLVMNIKFKSDNTAHVCEIQFIHEGLLSVRKTCGGHTAYNKFRSALELLEVHGALETEEQAAARRASTAVVVPPAIAWMIENGVKVKKQSEVNSVLTELNVLSVLDLASLNDVGLKKVVSVMKKNNQRKFNNTMPSTLASVLAAAIAEANGKSTVGEWLSVLCLESSSGAAQWMAEEGYEDELNDLKEMDEDEKKTLIKAAQQNGGAPHAVRVERALAALAEGDTDTKEKNTREKSEREQDAADKLRKSSKQPTVRF
jgi:hypothetical protein